MQCDFDTIGTRHVAADIETALVIHDLIRAIGAAFGKKLGFTIRVNNRAVLNGLLAKLNLADKSVPLLRSLDKLGKIGRDKVAEQGWARLLVEFRMVAARDPDLNARYATLHRQTRERLASVLRRLHDGVSLEPMLPVESMAEFILAVGVGTTVERAADPAALADEDLMLILPRALGLPDVQPAARAASAPTN